MNDTSKTVLITGASQGVGRALAIYFGSKGWSVIGVARNQKGLNETQQTVEIAGGQCEVHVVDLSKPDSFESLLANTHSLDVLIHNAADVTSKPLAETSPEEIAHLVATNLTGPLQLTRLLLPLLHAAHKPSIVHISSLAGYKPNPAQTAYSITKAGVNAMSNALRAELEKTGIHVLNVALASVNLTGASAPNKTPIDIVCRKIHRAIDRRQDELFFSPTTKILMRLYALLPWLAKLR